MSSSNPGTGEHVLPTGTSVKMVKLPALGSVAALLHTI